MKYIVFLFFLAFVVLWFWIVFFVLRTFFGILNTVFTDFANFLERILFKYTSRLIAEEPTPEEEKAGVEKWVYVVRICDALLFPVLFYLTIDAVSLHTIGIYSAKKTILVIGASLAILVGTIPWMKEAGSRLLKYASCPVTIAALSYLLKHHLQMPFSWCATHASWFGWIPSEWHHLPLAWGGLFIALWKFYLPFFALIALIIFVHVRGIRNVLLIFNILIVVLSVWFTLKSDPDAIYIVLMLNIPLFIAIVFGFFHQPLPERRFAVLGIFFSAVVANYIGLIPPIAPKSDFPGLTKIYPKPGYTSLVPLTHIRDVVVDEKKNRLYVSWGPTSGVFSVDIATNVGKHLYKGDTLRYIDFLPDKQTVYSVGFSRQNFIELSTEKNKLFRNVSLTEYGMGQLLLSRCMGSDVYISSVEPPMLGRFDYATFKPEAIRDFRNGQTRMRSGLGFFVFSSDGSKVYMNLGITDIPMTFTILEMDSKTLDVLRSFTVPEIPAFTLVYDDTTARLLFASGYTDKIFEIDLKTGAVARVHRGVIHARMLLYDKSRRWIIVGSFYTGTLAIIDRNSSRRLISRRIARRIQFGHISETSDSVYMTTTEGIYKIDLKEVEKYLSNKRLLKK